MKSIILFFILLSFANLGYSQCGCETISREDATIIQCPPDMLAKDSYSEVGLALSSNGNEVFISLNIRFISTPSDLSKNNLKITLSNNEIVSFQFVNSVMHHVAGSKMCTGIFLVPASHYSKIKLYRIKHIRYELKDGYSYTYNASYNTSVISIQAKCLKL